MRSVIAAVTVLLVSVVLLARAGLAEPPPPMEKRDIKKAIAALEKEKGRRGDLAVLRFASEVLAQTHVNGPVGSPITTLGAWSDNETLLSVEAALGGCGALDAEKEKKASALLKEFGGDLPLVPRAWTMGREGKKTEAAALLVDELKRFDLSKGCPGEHPMYSYRRISRMEVLLSCVKTFDPKRDAKPLQDLLEKAKACAANNHAVG
jgi:hypothetical protein